ncbi:hypothetical protein OsI_18682 [Oryza sativa Indica Group]|uniref:Glycosyltransferase n=1 Tax=Oryza sativa subsp. indica TaxID=39946 RepID=B8AYN8_ORYSI|nr:hypothetical protein OsI_18682 [Oryza sativa Indica Group]
MARRQQAHFLIVTYPSQGHVTPARHLARRLVHGAGARATVCVPVSAFRKMFPADDGEVVVEEEGGAVAYAAYSDGYDGGFDRAVDDHTRYMAQLSTVNLLPGLPPLRVRDIPSFLAITSDDDPFAFVLSEFAELIDTLERGGGGGGELPTYVLANTFDAMERDALASLRPHIDVVAVGPVLSFLHDADETKTASSPNDLFDHDGGGYLDWLGTKPARSVVYISFGSSSVMSKNQVAEIAAAMAESKKPFLWVIRKDNCKDDDDDNEAIKKLVAAAAAADTGGGGMAVEWCDQARVLSHASVGCFVTHCGWNSTVEAVACGVPVVAAPQYSDQGTSAWVVERIGVGVRAAARAGDGVVEAAELGRCVGAAMSEAVAGRAAAWREEARAAVARGGASERNLSEFVRRFVPK